QTSCVDARRLVPKCVPRRGVFEPHDARTPCGRHRTMLPQGARGVAHCGVHSTEPPSTCGGTGGNRAPPAWCSLVMRELPFRRSDVTDAALLWGWETVPAPCRL